MLRIIFGIPLANSFARKEDRSQDLHDFIEGEGRGIIVREKTEDEDVIPAVFGVEIGAIPTGEHHVEADTLFTTPQPFETQEFSDVFSQLTPELRQEISKFGKPRVVIL